MRILLVMLVFLTSAKVSSAACKVPELACVNATSCGYNDKTQNYKYCNVYGHAIVLNDNNKYEYETIANDKEVSSDYAPCATTNNEINTVSLKGYTVPSNCSYQDLLEAKNMFKVTTLHLSIPAVPKLESYHLRNLSVYELRISAKNSSLPPRPAGDFLKYASNLRSLWLLNVIPETGEWEPFPNQIQTIHLEYTQMEKWTNGSVWLEQLQSLTFLFMNNEYSKEVPFKLPKLRLLSKLKEVRLNYVPLNTTSLDGCLNGSSVEQLVLNSCGLNYIPNGMFVGANLTFLELKHNQLIVPEGMLFGLHWLTKLDVTNTSLDGQALLKMVSQLSRLDNLIAGNNPLGSICLDVDNSWLKSKWHLPESLQNLDLRNTQATQICLEWITDGDLRHIDLRENVIGDITVTTYSELMTTRRKQGDLILDLDDNSTLRIVNVTSTSLQNCRNATLFPGNSNNSTLIVTTSNFKCDCGTQYWLRQVTKYCTQLTLENSDPDAGFIDDTEEVLCNYSGACLPNCSCWNRPRDNAMVLNCKSSLPPMERWPTELSDALLALHVAPYTLTAIPRAKLIELHAANNNISSLEIHDIPATLRILNITNNSISSISVAAAQRLEAIGTNLSLVGNFLACTCSDVPAFDILKRVVHRWNSTQCMDQSLVSERTESDLCTSQLVQILLSVITSILLVLAIAALLMYKYKAGIRQILFKLNMFRRYIHNAKDNTDDGKIVDAFLSYPYEDFNMLNKLKTGLETRGYSVIEHQRDWLPGEPIKEQINRSVLSARRTILFVSDNFARSIWAPVEFRQAHAHAMERRTARVLIIRWNLTSVDNLPPDLKTYLKYNTYLDWDDEDFWRKLCRYMPPKRLKDVLGSKYIEC